MEQMTEEQRDLIAESQKHPEGELSQDDQGKLKQAEELAALIEAQSYSNIDLVFENKTRQRYGRHDEENLTDDQLAELFGSMKRETQAKRQEEMQKFKFENTENQDSGALDLIDEFNDELNAMMGRD